MASMPFILLMPSSCFLLYMYVSETLDLTATSSQAYGLGLRPCQWKDMLQLVVGAGTEESVAKPSCFCTLGQTQS